MRVFTRACVCVLACVFLVLWLVFCLCSNLFASSAFVLVQARFVVLWFGVACHKLPTFGSVVCGLKEPGVLVKEFHF